MKQWIREYQLIGVDAGSQGLDLSELRIQFDIRKTATPTPNAAKIRICNMAVGTAKKAKAEFKRIQLKAGYRGASDMVFDGNIKEARIGRNKNNSYLDILAGDGDEAYVHSTVSKTLNSGCCYQDVFEAAAKPMCCGGDAGLSLGRIDIFDKVTFPRGRVLFGMSRDFIESLCFTDNKWWSIQNRKLQVVDHKTPLPSVFVISEETGMIEVPEEVNEGLRVRCLLNPKLIPDCQVKIESKHLSDIAASAEGYYRVLQVDMFGDTHGDEWFSDLICVAVNGATDSESRNG